MSDKKTEYPVTKETMHSFAESLFAPIRRGENVTTVWVPMAGRRMWSKFIIENIHLFESELPNFEKYVLVYVEPLDLTEESLSGYLRLMAKSFIEKCEESKICNASLSKNLDIFDNEEATYTSLLAALKEMLQDVVASGLEIIFFLGEFDELGFANKVFYNNLKSIWNQLYPGLHYIFLMREGVVKHDNIIALGDFSEVILQNIVHVQMLGEKDINYLIDRISDQLGLRLTDKQISLLKKVCGGHAYSLKVALRVLANYESEKLTEEKIKSLLLDHYELRSVSRGILEVLDHNELEVLSDVAKGHSISSNIEREKELLLNLGLIVEENESFRVFSTLVENALTHISIQEFEKKVDADGLAIDSETEAITFNTQTVEENFTAQEYNLLKMFIKNANVLKTRDDIGEVLWGNDSYEKYSDWAIDQLISKLRKKLKEMNVKDSLITIRGKGYKLVKAK